jgi:hypothetical protein
MVSQRNTRAEAVPGDSRMKGDILILDAYTDSRTLNQSSSLRKDRLSSQALSFSSSFTSHVGIDQTYLQILRGDFIM